MDQRTGEHTAWTSLAFLYVHQEIPICGWNLTCRNKNLSSSGRVGWRRALICRETIASTSSRHDNNGSSDFEEISASNTRAISLLTIHQVTFPFLDFKTAPALSPSTVSRACSQSSLVVLMPLLLLERRRQHLRMYCTTPPSGYQRVRQTPIWYEVLLSEVGIQTQKLA